MNNRHFCIMGNETVVPKTMCSVQLSLDNTIVYDYVV